MRLTARLARPAIVALLVLIRGPAVRAADMDNWWTYTADRDGKSAVVALDTGLRRQAPVSGYNYVVIASASYSSPRDDGLPDTGEAIRQDALSKALAAALSRKMQTIFAGTVTRDFMQQTYLYVIDPNGLADVIKPVFTRQCPGCKTSFTVRQDSDWSVYRDTLQPDAATREKYNLRAY